MTSKKETLSLDVFVAEEIELLLFFTEEEMEFVKESAELGEEESSEEKLSALENLAAKLRRSLAQVVKLQSAEDMTIN